jgi:hypothetical protein
MVIPGGQYHQQPYGQSIFPFARQQPQPVTSPAYGMHQDSLRQGDPAYPPPPPAAY